MYLIILKLVALHILYPHDYPNDWVKQNYMPKNLIGKKYYIPKNNKVEENLNKLHKEMRNEK